MSFDLRNFVKRGLLSAIGIQSDYWVILTSANWYTKGVLTTDDLAEIQDKIDEKNTPVEPVIEEPIEEISEENTADVAEEETPTEEVGE